MQFSLSESIPINFGEAQPLRMTALQLRLEKTLLPSLQNNIQEEKDVEKNKTYEKNKKYNIMEVIKAPVKSTNNKKSKNAEVKNH